MAIVYAGIRLLNLDAVCLDGDEMFSFGLAGRDWGSLIEAAATDSIHPPLFYFLLKMWVRAGGDSLYWLRLLPVVLSVMALAPVVLLGRALDLRPAEIRLSLAVMAVHPLLIFYTQDVRMYSLLMLCAPASLWLFQRALAAGRGFAALTAVNIVLVYAHYYGCVIVALEFGYVLLWRRRHLRAIAASAAAVLAAFSPWLWIAGGHAIAKGGLAVNLVWIEKPTVARLLWCIADMAGLGELGAIARPAAAVLVLLVGATGWAAWRERARLRPLQPAARFLLFFSAGTIGVAFAASHGLPQSVWGHRHMVFVAMLASMMLATAYLRFDSRAVRVCGATLLALWASLMIHSHARGDDQKAAFDTLTAALLEREGDGPAATRLYSADRYIHYPIWFFTEALAAGKTTGMALRLDEGKRREYARIARRIEVVPHATIDQARGHHFWVGYSSFWTEARPPQELLRERGCRVGPDSTVTDRYRWFTIFPVWCDR